MKEGLLYGPDKNDKVLDLVAAPSTNDAEKLTTLDDYVARMGDDQTQIYYLAHPNLELARNSPHLEAFKAKGLEVLFFTDQVDSLWRQQNPTVQGQNVCRHRRRRGRAAQGQGRRGRRQRRQGLRKGRRGQAIVDSPAQRLQENVKDVRTSKRLTDSPACLITDKGDMTPQMENLLRVSGQSPPKTKRVLEINPNHPAVKKLATLVAEGTAVENAVDDASANTGEASDANPVKRPTRRRPQHPRHCNPAHNCCTARPCCQRAVSWKTRRPLPAWSRT